MRAIIKPEECVGFKFTKDHPIRKPTGDECLVQIKAVAICGSETG